MTKTFIIKSKNLFLAHDNYFGYRLTDTLKAAKKFDQEEEALIAIEKINRDKTFDRFQNTFDYSSLEIKESKPCGCIKCGKEKITIKYFPDYDSRVTPQKYIIVGTSKISVPDTDFLLNMCECGYAWVTNCLDKGN